MSYWRSVGSTDQSRSVSGQRPTIRAQADELAIEDAVVYRRIFAKNGAKRST
jgi:hypothetical protein